jgi:hypothetical protein
LDHDGARQIWQKSLAKPEGKKGEHEGDEWNVFMDAQVSRNPPSGTYVWIIISVQFFFSSLSFLFVPFLTVMGCIWRLIIPWNAWTGVAGRRVFWLALSPQVQNFTPLSWVSEAVLFQVPFACMSFLWGFPIADRSYLRHFWGSSPNRSTVSVESCRWIHVYYYDSEKIWYILVLWSIQDNIE